MMTIKPFALLLAAVVLSGCAVDNTMRFDGSASRTLSLKASDPDGVLILGLPRPGFFETHSRPVHGVDLFAYDPTGNLLIPPEKGGRAFMLSEGGLAFDIVDTVDSVQYIVQRIPAGQYYLTRVYWGPYGQTLMSDGSISVEIQPGTVTYVGNPEFRTPLLIFQDVELLVVVRDDDAARSVLAKYPNIEPDMQVATPRIFKLSCNLDDGIDACYAQ